jgi:uncharacterized membrane protein (DUF441 family)
LTLGQRILSAILVGIVVAWMAVVGVPLLARDVATVLEWWR